MSRTTFEIPGRALNITKVVQIVNYLISKYGHSLNYTKLIKLLYIADKECLRRFGLTITNDTYVCMKMGPVLSYVYTLIGGKAETSDQAEWNRYFFKENFDLRLTTTNFLTTGELSKAEKEILDSIDKKYHGWNYSKLVDLVHNKKLFPETIETDSVVPLEIDTILRSVNFSDEEITAYFAEREFQQAIRSFGK